MIDLHFKNLENNSKRFIKHIVKVNENGPVYNLYIFPLPVQHKNFLSTYTNKNGNETLRLPPFFQDSSIVNKFN